MTRTIRMVERRDRTSYWQATTAQVAAMLAARTIRFEGVDGDEDADTVTYWYTSDTEEV